MDCLHNLTSSGGLRDGTLYYMKTGAVKTLEQNLILKQTFFVRD